MYIVSVAQHRQHKQSAHVITYLLHMHNIAVYKKCMGVMEDGVMEDGVMEEGELASNCRNEYLIRPNLVSHNSVVLN